LDHRPEFFEWQGSEGDCMTRTHKVSWMSSKQVSLCYCYTLAKRSSCSPTDQNPLHVFPQTYIYWPQVIHPFCSHKYWCLVSSTLGWSVARGAGGKHNKMEEVSSTINSYIPGTSLVLLRLVMPYSRHMALQTTTAVSVTHYRFLK
jgi:hypothetical protein